MTDTKIAFGGEVHEEAVEVGLIARTQLTAVKLGVGDVGIDHNDFGKRIKGKQASERKAKAGQHDSIESQVERFVEVEVTGAGDGDQARIIASIEQGNQVAFRAPKAAGGGQIGAAGEIGG